MNTEDSPPSRWQQLYSSSRNDVETSSNRQSQWQKIIHNVDEQEDDEVVITSWLDSIPSSSNSRHESSTPTTLHYDMNTFENELLLQTRTEEYEADKIINDLELMIRNHDEDLMDSILESQRHQDAISEFRTKKKARSFLCAWNSYTKSQLSQRQFISQAVNDMICHNMLARSFRVWKKHWKEYCDEVGELVLGQKRKRTGRHFCAWVNEICIQSQTTRVRFFQY